MKQYGLLTLLVAVELGGRVVRVLDSGQLHQSERRSWVRFLVGPLKIARPQDSHVVTCPAGGPGKTRLTRPSTPSSSVELGGRVVRVLDSGQLHQSERSWVRFLDELLKNCQASGQSRGHVSSGWTRKNTIDYAFYSELIRGARCPSG